MSKVSENPFKNRESLEKVRNAFHPSVSSVLVTQHARKRIRKINHTPLMVVTALFVTLYLISNIMAVKVISIFGLFYFDAGTITFPFAYMLGDVLTEIWGYHIVKRIIWLTLLCNVIMVICTAIGVWLPSPDYLAETAHAYNHIFTYVPRIVIASLAGFLFGELSNAWLMERIKKMTKGKWLWIRTIGSSAIAYIFDSLPFVIIAFAGTVSTHDLIMMIFFQYFSKLIIEATMGTPMAYSTIHYIKRFYH